jgi:hypothetical protein
MRCEFEALEAELASVLALEQHILSLLTPADPSVAMKDSESTHESSSRSNKGKARISCGKESSQLSVIDCADIDLIQVADSSGVLEFDIQETPPFRQAVCMICFDAVTSLRPDPDRPSSSNDVRMYGCFFECLHACCEECLRSWVIAALGDRTLVPLRCGACSALMDTTGSTFADIVGSAAADRLHQRELVARMKHPVFCPNRECQNVFEAPEFPEESRPPSWFDVSCMNCGQRMCLSCGVRYHEGLSCEEFENLPADDREVEDLELYRLANTKAWRRCPGCSLIVVKEEGKIGVLSPLASFVHLPSPPLIGCNHMTCICKIQFCYTCGLSYKQAGSKAVPSCTCDLFAVPPETPECARVTAVHATDRLIVVEQEEHVDPLLLQPRAEHTPLGRIGIADRYHSRAQKAPLPRWLLAAWRACQCHYCGETFGSLADLDQHQSTTTNHAV